LIGAARGIRRTVYAASAVALLVTGAALAVAQRALGEVAAARQEIASVVDPLALAAEDFERTVLHRAVAVRNLVLTGDPRHRDLYDREVERARSLLGALSGGPQDPESLASLEAVEEDARIDVAETEAFLSAVARGVGADELAAAERQLAAVRARLLARARELAVAQQAKQRAARARAAELEGDVRTVLLLGALAVALGLGGAALLTVRALRRPAVALVAAAEAAEASDFAPALALARSRAAASRGELGRLVAAVARMADRLRRREERLAAEARIGAALATTLDPPAIAAAALAELAAHVGAAIGAVYVLEGEALVRAAGHGGPDVLPREGIVAEALARGRPVRLGAIPKDLPFAMAAGFGQVWPRSVVAVPLAARGERVGLLLLGSLGELDGDALSLAERAGGELGIALQSALAHRRLNALVADLRGARHEAQGASLGGHPEAIHAQASDHRDEVDEVGRGQGARRTDGRPDHAAPTLAPSPEGPERRAPVAYRSR
jgi:hypothetical protein